MKVVVFAHTPPPHHGQSYMVELMLRGFADAKYGVQCFHVNAQFATESKDIGKFRPGKVFRLFGYVAKAIWLRFRHNARALYYVPTPPLKTPLYRDWAILLILRPFFRTVIFHWHAAGLGEWIEGQPGWMRRMTHLALGRADLSISLGKHPEQDAARFHPRRSVIIPYGIPDPCPDFEAVRRDRKSRLQSRSVVKALYLGLCTEEKGLFDAMRGTARANVISRERNLPFQFNLDIAGPFFNAASEQRYAETLRELGQPEWIRHLGFVAGEAKTKALSEMDLLLFPTYYYGESFGIVIIEAMAFGAPVLATKWRSIPDLFPPDYPGLVNPKAPEEIAEALLRLAVRDDTDAFRQRFLDNFALEKFLANLAQAFREAAQP